MSDAEVVAAMDAARNAFEIFLVAPADAELERAAWGEVLDATERARKAIKAANRVALSVGKFRTGSRAGRKTSNGR